MTPRWILLLLLAAGSCARPSERAAAAHDRAVEALEQGDLKRAEELVLDNEARWRGDARSTWHWQFRLLHAEVLLAQGKAAEAMALADTPLTVDGTLAPLEARRVKIRGHAAMNLARYDEAKNLLDDASRRAAAAGLPRLALEVQILQGLLLIRSGSEAAGESVTRAAYARATEQHDAYWQAAAANNLGLQRMRAFRYDEAIPLLEQARDAAASVKAQRFAAASLANLGICHYRIGDFDKALAFLQQAADVQEATGALTGLQSSLGEIGNVHVMQGHADRAVGLYERALALARTSAPWESAKWAGNLAAAHAELKHWDEAERFNRESLRLQEEVSDTASAAYASLDAAAIAFGRGQQQEAIRLYEEAIARARDNAELTWEANAGLGASYARLGSPVKASLFYERCLQSIDAARTRLSRVDYKLTFFARLVRFYQAYVDVLVARGEHEKALQVAESSRALLLSERLQLGRDRRTPVTRTGLQQAARRRGATFLSYWIGPDRSFLWVVNDRTFTVLVLPGRDRIAALVDAYRAFIESSLRDPIAGDFQPARELYEILLAPARPFIPQGAHLIVVPDGPLHALNLETLPVPDPDPARSPSYMIEQATISIAPALGYAAGSIPREPSRPAPILVIGDPEPAGPDFPRLPDAGREIKAIRDKFGAAATTVLSGAQATPDAYRAAQPERYSIIHLAAHATANRASPLDSAVILSPRDNRFMLSARDVLAIPLRADLVTISACRSAGATVYGGEGLVGFVWAFLQAGARRVVAGLWDASDRSTSRLMDVMYAGLHTGKRPADALRGAKLSLISAGGTFAHPYYWGPFQIYEGEGPPALQ